MLMSLELPPSHAVLVHFPSALVPLSLFCDALALLFRRHSLRAAAWWMLLFAAVFTPLTVLTGWWWWLQMDRPATAIMIAHRWLGTALALLIVLAAVWRGRLHRGGRPGRWGYFVVATVLALAVVIQGHLGGVMSFGGEARAPGNAANQVNTIGRALSSGSSATAPAPPSQQPEATRHWRPFIDLSKE